MRRCESVFYFSRYRNALFDGNVIIVFIVAVRFVVGGGGVADVLSVANIVGCLSVADRVRQHEIRGGVL